MRLQKLLSGLAAGAAAAACGFSLAHAQAVSPATAAGPDPTPKGWLIIQGGGNLTPEMIERFTALAGGPAAHVVRIPTALGTSELEMKVRAGGLLGLSDVATLDTTNRRVADSLEFTGPLRTATGIFIDGGRQWRLADAYIGTKTQTEIIAAYARGAVVMGGSAGATIQASFLTRGDPASYQFPDGDNRIVVAPGHTTGFGLLPNSAIDQHVNTRHREADLVPVVKRHPELIGIGIDESAAIVVHGDAFFVVGGRVLVTDGRLHSGLPYLTLQPGQKFNLSTREVDTSDAYDDPQSFPLKLIVRKSSRARTMDGGLSTVEADLVDRDGKSESVSLTCNASLYAIGAEKIPAARGMRGWITIMARPLGSMSRERTNCRPTQSPK